MLRRGDLLPHFTVRAVGGVNFVYSSIWQHRNLVLVLAATDAGLADEYAEALAARRSEFEALSTACIVTRDAVDGLPADGFVIADRWGEIVHIALASRGPLTLTPDELLAWITHTAMRCPECEGETR